MSEISDRIARTNTRRRNGILCPSCAEPLGVSYTRSKPNGCILRVRSCRHCGHKLRTCERPELKPVPLMDAVR